MAVASPCRVVIAGGGFGGLYAALALDGRAGPGRLEITLVDRAQSFVFKPLLYELLTDEVAEADVAFPFTALLEGTRIRHVSAAIGGIDLDGRRLVLEPAEPGGPAELGFDAAAIALGSEPDYRGLPGLAEHTFPAGSLHDFGRLRAHLDGLVPGTTGLPRDPASRPHGSGIAREPGAGARRTIAVCGAGPSGVEIACKLVDRFARRRAGDRAPWRIVLVEASAVILPGFTEEVKARALSLLGEKRVDVRLRTPVRCADAGGLEIGPAGAGERLATGTVIWTAGQRPVPVVRGLPAERDASGRLLVPDTLEIPGREAIFALGDNARCVVEGLEAPPATAQVAVQQAKVVARNILARADGRTLSSFRYFPLAETLSLGRGYDIFSVLGLRLEGRTAHVVRRLAYIARLPGGWRQRATAGARWGMRLATDALGAGIAAFERASGWNAIGGDRP